MKTFVLLLATLGVAAVYSAPPGSSGVVAEKAAQKSVFIPFDSAKDLGPLNEKINCHFCCFSKLELDAENVHPQKDNACGMCCDW